MQTDIQPVEFFGSLKPTWVRTRCSLANGATLTRISKAGNAHRPLSRIALNIAKYNQLLRIEEDLGDTVTYPGRSTFYNLRRG